MLLCHLPKDLLNNSTLAAQQCSGDLAPDAVCIALCPNTDLAGIGVRLAFYMQSFFNTLLVIFSPRDSVPTAWASTLLTAALIIAAIVQKIQNPPTMTLHHAILVLNYATLSCISSLAVAPILPIWRLRPGEYYARELARHGITSRSTNGHDGEDILENGLYHNAHKKKIKKAQNKQRVVLALALLIQVVLQWAWATVMFVSPAYSQRSCSEGTVLFFFFWHFTVGEINGDKFFVWALWLLFCLSITLLQTVALAVSSPNRAYDSWSRLSTNSTRSSESPRTPLFKQLFYAAVAHIPPWKDRTKQLIFWGNVLAFGLWSMYIIISEIQIKANCIFDGENNFGGFGQVTAILLALVPLWSLTVAIYKYPSELRREKQRRAHQQAETQSLVLDDGPSPSQDHTTVAADQVEPSTRPAVRTGSRPLETDEHGMGLRSRGVQDVGAVESFELTFMPRTLPFIL